MTLLSATRSPMTFARADLTPHNNRDRRVCEGDKQIAHEAAQNQAG